MKEHSKTINIQKNATAYALDQLQYYKYISPLSITDACSVEKAQREVEQRIGALCKLYLLYLFNQSVVFSSIASSARAVLSSSATVTDRRAEMHFGSARIASR